MTVWSATRSLERLVGAVARSPRVRRLRYSLERYAQESPIWYTRLKPNPDELREIMELNRRRLATIPKWIDAETLRGAVNKFGMPASVARCIDRPVGDEDTYTDLMVYLGRRLKKPVRYLEIGVSVGKNLYQMIHALRNAEIVGVDIEDMNPTLEGQLVRETQVEWEACAGSLRTRRATLSSYRVPSSENRVSYLAGDIFDRQSWERLRGRQFNLIFSDADHSADGLRAEYEAWRSLDLLDRDEFIIVWDDLERLEMRSEFERITVDLARSRGLTRGTASFEFYRGWVGVHERKHMIGVLQYLEGSPRISRV